jgi:hypothetical protein
MDSWIVQKANREEERGVPETKAKEEILEKKRSRGGDGRGNREEGRKYNEKAGLD